MLFLVAGVLRRSVGSHRRFGWERLGLALVPAAWLLLNAVPMAMVLAYANLPHSHRLHSQLVRHAWRVHSFMLVFVAATMVNAAALHGRGGAHLALAAHATHSNPGAEI